VFKQICAVTLAVLFLAACAQQPNQITLELPPQPNISPVATGATVRLESRDLRTASYVVAIHGDQEPAELLGASQNLRQLIAEQLSNRWQQQGLRLDPEANSRLRIELQQLLAEVNQGTFSHQVDSHIRIKVEYSDEQGSFSKLFRSTASSKGILKVNVEKLQQQLSEQLVSVIEDITNDEQLRQRLQLIP